jgi:aspartyl-tRNA(Asn)/glutamyl-tRNA(Gln) amidotransferase subunit A
MSLYHLTIEEAHRQLVRGDLSAVTLTQAVLDRIAAVEPRIGAYLTLDARAPYAGGRRRPDASPG